MSNESRLRSNLEKTRNTDEQMTWYEDMEKFVGETEWSPLDKTTFFPIFSTRQAITRFIETYELYKMVQNVPGSFVECGVASGQFLMALAHFCSIFEGYHYLRRVIGFDTFEGFVEINDQDKGSGAEHMKTGGLAFDSYEILEQAAELYDRNRVLGHIPKIELVRGDISKTLPEYLEKNPHLIVGMLHLDLDLYKPTKDTLELLISRIPKGGMIVFDEPNCKDYPGETIAIMETLGLPNLRMQRLDVSSMAAYCIIE